MKIATVQIPDEALEHFMALMAANGWTAEAHDDDLPPIPEAHKALILKRLEEWDDSKARDAFEALDEIRAIHNI